MLYQNWHMSVLSCTINLELDVFGENSLEERPCGIKITCCVNFLGLIYSQLSFCAVVGIFGAGVEILHQSLNRRSRCKTTTSRWSFHMEIHQGTSDMRLGRVRKGYVVSNAWSISFERCPSVHTRSICRIRFQKTHVCASFWHILFTNTNNNPHQSL